ncbi:MAG: ABC transporter substrate-binding protein [Mangrovibacterium sp.]
MKKTVYTLVAGMFLSLLSVRSFAGYPERIISLAPSLTKILYWLDEEDRLVGCTSYCTLENPDDAQIVGSAVQVNLERAVLLCPDLVIASSLISPETLRSFEKLGIEVLQLNYPRSFDDLCHQVLVLGRKLGREELAEKRVAETRERLERIRALVPDADRKPRIFLQIGANPLFTAVPNTFLQDFIDFAGCENIAADLKTGSITRETVLVRDPDVILVLLMGTVSSREKGKWETYKNLKAVKNHRVYVMDDEKTCSPTPSLFVDALEEITGLIYGKQLSGNGSAGAGNNLENAGRQPE